MQSGPAEGILRLFGRRPGAFRLGGGAQKRTYPAMGTQGKAAGPQPELMARPLPGK